LERLAIYMAADLYRRAFARAAEILGGRRWLVVYLGTNLAQLKKWAARGARPPLDVLLALTQVLQHGFIKNYMGPRRARPARRGNRRGHRT